MADEIYTVPDKPEYDPHIRKLQDEDPVSASLVVNPLIARLIENTAAVKRAADEAAFQAETAAARAKSLEQTVSGLEKLTGAEDPTSETAAQFGQIYINILTGTEWKCTAVGGTGTSWEEQTGPAARLTAEDVGAVSAEEKGEPGGVAGLDESGKVPAAQLPSLAPYVAGTSAPGDKTKLWIDTTANTGGLKYWNGSVWTHVPVAYT